MFGLFKAVPSITTSELEARLKSPMTLLDVRTPNEYRGGHITKAKNVPLNKIHTYNGSPDEKVYVICQSGMRSKNAAKQLMKMGYQVTNVRGGMSQWTGKIRGGK
ncbi:rhodanese-like domain-containing protein [Enterococcus alcedinis]|uniref:Sulfurtransferase n=1 Tax=Enterococcus alcedinis TaxID=1274384 RepID=A0A917JEN2_9ENTE|nr:rhodanese-like domain-containing protein [Enterococcus alcedinis]MBP2101823.1 rhodanese-related sulfurtransferase [Enterococcus alcedinis]GGI65386.1 sulfurtransferase [Enterococcus alcedinis]